MSLLHDRGVQERRLFSDLQLETRYQTYMRHTYNGSTIVKWLVEHMLLERCMYNVLEISYCVCTFFSGTECTQNLGLPTDSTLSLDFSCTRDRKNKRSLKFLHMMLSGHSTELLQNFKLIFSCLDTMSVSEINS